MLEVWQWQNLSPFGGRLIGDTVEVLLTKVVNWQLSVSLVVAFFIATAVSIITKTVLKESLSRQH